MRARPASLSQQAACANIDMGFPMSKLLMPTLIAAMLISVPPGPGATELCGGGLIESLVDIPEALAAVQPNFGRLLNFRGMVLRS